jgi:hypothetical protein
MERITIDQIETLMNHQHTVNLAPNGTVTVIPAGSASQELIRVVEEKEKLRSELNALRKLLDTPEVEDFDKAVPLEAAHQVKRWTAEHDAGKTPEDWFWLLGYLSGKALAAARMAKTMTDTGFPLKAESFIDKAKHHCISSAAVLRSWHAHLRTGQTAMRPGIDTPKE